jgi:GTPase KRas protein
MEYRLVVLGPGGVGKSALTIQLTHQEYVDSHNPTIEDSYRHDAEIDGEACRLDILDTAGQEEFVAMRDSYMSEGEGFLCVYSITDRNSFEEMAGFHKHISRVKNELHVPMILVGNKCDLAPEKRVVSKEEGEKLAKTFNCPFLEASAKERINTEECFFKVVREIRKYRQARGWTDKKRSKPTKGCSLY